MSLLRTRFSEPVALGFLYILDRSRPLLLLSKDKKLSFTICLTFEGPEKVFFNGVLTMRKAENCLEECEKN